MNLIQEEKLEKEYEQIKKRKRKTLVLRIAENGVRIYSYHPL